MNLEDHIKRAKRFAVRNEDDLAANEFAASVAFYTDRDDPRLVFFPQINAETRPILPWAFTVLSAGLDNLTQIAFVTDSYRSSSTTRLNGEPWGVGGMQHAVENQTEDAHLVTEGLNYQVVTADAALAVMIPYRRVGSGIEFDWDGIETIEDNGFDVRLDGYFPTAMRSGFEAPKLMKTLTEQFNVTPDSFGLTEEEARIHTMAVAVKLVMQQTHMKCLIPAFNEAEQERIKESFNGGPFNDGIMAFDKEQANEIVQLEEAFELEAYEGGQ